LLDQALPQIYVQFDAPLDDVNCIEPPYKPLDLDLLVLERLVILEEPLDRFQPVFGQAGKIGVRSGEEWIRERRTQRGI